MEEKKICRVCGRELEIDKFLVAHGKATDVCKECANKKKAETWAKKRKERNLEQELENAKVMRLQDFTPRQLMSELYRRGYEGTLKYTRIETIDISKL